MKFFAALLALTAVAQAQDCPLTSRLYEDWVEYTEEAEELGWYSDGFVQIDNIVEDVGQAVFDGCQALSQEVNADNVKDKVAEFYGLDVPEGEAGPCWDDQDVVRQAKQVILFDCLGLEGEEDDRDNEGGSCPLTSKLEHDWEVITEEATEKGWYADGFVQIDNIVEDLGQETFDGCQALAQEINGQNVAEKVREFYGIEGNENSTPGGGACWDDDIVRVAKQTVLFDCLFEAEGVGLIL